MTKIHFNKTTTLTPEQYTDSSTWGGRGVLEKAFANSISALEARSSSGSPEPVR